MRVQFKDLREILLTFIYLGEPTYLHSLGRHLLAHEELGRIQVCSKNEKKEGPKALLGGTLFRLKILPFIQYLSWARHVPST